MWCLCFLLWFFWALQIRDTSVLVKLRPAWEDLKNYLTAKGRKRFEVYVCTMAERDYALEMWRLLDPEAHLISSKQQLDRIVCVKSDGRKSLLTVFQQGSCHPKMAMVIDDRLKVWEDRDQPRVHVVPAFTPYYAPQAEMANAVPVLCVARNVACNVRGGFFKEFDENLLQKIPEVHYEDEVVGLPSAPDVSNYLMSEDASFVPNGNTNAPFPEGISGPEAAQRLNYMGEKSFPNSFTHSINNNPELKENPQLSVEATPNVVGPTSSRAVPFLEKPSMLGASFKRDNSFSDSDPDVKRKLPIMSRGQDARSRVSAEPAPTPKLPGQHHHNPPSQGGWLMEEDLGTGRLNGRLSGAVQDSDAQKLEKQRPRPYSNSHGTSSSNAGGSHMGAAQVINEEVHSRQDGLRPNQFTGFGSQNQSSANISEPQPEGSKLSVLPSVSISVLQEIGRRCNSKVEFRPLVSTSEDLRFSFEVLFTGEKIGFGMGKTRKDAQQQAAENALHALADKYKAHNANRSKAVDREFNRNSATNENGLIWDVSSPGSNSQQPVENGLPKQSTYKVA
ncbi:OLC1v1033716C1 [Oldenlandia corymbosa var. corymbosa]|uniref:protein-serine/threonine phosphatase n=1 Tax=Oldenlandia corymbosa var. corymbosa TaxID=529605 RepID=A0AAV1CRS2_OLDCO|nr:OLC1v1033716C1 [Oldenlandia corymbosa var. corymbosa]